jgi:hypothetical protein
MHGKTDASEKFQIAQIICRAELQFNQSCMICPTVGVSIYSGYQPEPQRLCSAPDIAE